MTRLNYAIETVNRWLSPDISELASAYKENYERWKEDFERTYPGKRAITGADMMDFTEQEFEYWRIMDMETDIMKQKLIYENWGYIEFYEHYILWLAKNYKQYVKSK